MNAAGEPLRKRLVQWWWAFSAAVGVAVCIAVGLLLHFTFELSTSDSTSIVLVLLTIIAIGVAGVAARYALLSARAAAEAVEPLKATASTLVELAAREESVVAALGGLLAQAQREAARQEMVDELNVLREMKVTVRLMAIAVAELAAGDTSSKSRYRSAQTDLQAQTARFPPGRLNEAIGALANTHVLAMLSAPTSNADMALDQEIHQVHEQLRALREGA